MTTYSIRCRHQACRHRRVSTVHPDDYKVVPRCPVCGNRKGWRIEQRAYNKRGLCHCSGPLGRNNEPFPHRITHPSCDQHPHGIYNQARARGVAHDDIPEEYRPMEIKRIDGATRTFGAPHDWDAETHGKCYGLPIRDVTVEGTPFMVSAWAPTPQELQMLLDGETLKLWISGTVHPVVCVSVGAVE